MTEIPYRSTRKSRHRESYGQKCHLRRLKFQVYCEKFIMILSAFVLITFTFNHFLYDYRSNDIIYIVSAYTRENKICPWTLASK